MNVLLDETRSDRIEFGLPWLRELRVSPTVKRVLAEEKPSHLGWGEFAILAMVAFVLIARIMRGELHGVIRLVRLLLGPLPDDAPGDPTSVGATDIAPGDPRRPLARAGRGGAR